MPPIQLVVCDMAGTTIQDQNEVQQCFFAAADRTGLKAEPDQITAMMGWSKKRVFQTLWHQQLGADHPDCPSKIEASFVQFREILEAHYHTAPVHPTEGCLELFAWLKDHQVAIALTTGFYREVTNIILQRLGWDQGLNSHYVGTTDSIIQASVTPSEIFHQEGRPAPFMIQKAMYRLGIADPQTVVNIGDTPSDIASGINAHCRYSFGITNGTHSRSQLEIHPNDGLLDSLVELKHKLAGLIAA